MALTFEEFERLLVGAGVAITHGNEEQVWTQVSEGMWQQDGVDIPVPARHFVGALTAGRVVGVEDLPIRKGVMLQGRQYIHLMTTNPEGGMVHVASFYPDGRVYRLDAVKRVSAYVGTERLTTEFPAWRTTAIALTDALMEEKQQHAATKEAMTVQQKGHLEIAAQVRSLQEHLEKQARLRDALREFIGEVPEK